jgi:tight adherence protein C
MIPQLIAGLAGIALFLAVVGFYDLTTGERRQVSRRLSELESSEPDPETAVHYLGSSSLPWAWRLISFLGWVLPHVLVSESLEWDLIQAGYRHPHARRVYAGCKILMASVLGLGALIGSALMFLPQGYIWLLALTMGLLGYFVPNFWLAYTHGRRCQEIRQALPDALDLMVICVEAGQGLNAALVSVGREIALHCRALSEELRLVNHEMRIGQTRSQALRNFSMRTGVDEVRALAAVLIQSDRIGSSVGKALRVHAQSMRTRRRQRAEEAARKTTVKLVFPLVLFIFPELLVVILAPAVIQMLRVLGHHS